MLRIDSLRVNYGGIEAVKDISFTVPEGKIVTLIGANGAGKSTFLKMLAGLYPSRNGEREVNGSIRSLLELSLDDARDVNDALLRRLGARQL